MLLSTRQHFSRVQQRESRRIARPALCAPPRACTGNMATPAAVLAVVRASGQNFRGPEDAVVYAIHAALLASGCALVGVGDAATLEGTSSDAPEVPDDGWAAHDDRYTFLYRAPPPPSSSSSATATAAAAQRLVLLKVLSMGGGALVATLAAGASPGDTEPSVLEIDAPKYYEASAAAAAASDAAAPAAPAVPAAQRYKDLDELLPRVTSALTAVTAAVVTASGSGTAKTAPAGGAAAAAAAAAAEERRRRELEDRPQRPAPGRGFEDDPLRIGPPRRPNPLRAGEDDIMPLLGGGGPLGGGIGGGPLLPPGMGGPGGMHVGPGHPFFADRMRHPDLGPGGMMGRGRHPGGARWDPINPEGLEGWRPEDFERPPPGGPGRGGPPSMPAPIDPDLEQPGPRRTDWDSMYG